MIEWLRRARPVAEAPLPPLRLGDRLVPIELRRLPHARRMTLRLAPDGQSVRISLPTWVPAHDALTLRGRAATGWRRKPRACPRRRRWARAAACPIAAGL
jgi:predicted metal-dependent hydrolase